MWKNVVIVVLSIIFLSSAFPLHQAMGQQAATVGVQLSTTSGLNPTDTLSANITVSNVIDLYGWQVSLYYKSSVLSGIHVDEGPFLKDHGATSELIVSNFTDYYNATYGIGYLLVACSLLASDAGVTGGGTLATVTFTVVGAGSCVLHIETTGQYGTELESSTENLMPYTTVDGELTAIPEFPSFTILPLLMIATLVSLAAFRKWKMTGAKPKQ